jgi:hypothetical protein
MSPSLLQKSPTSVVGPSVIKKPHTEDPDPLGMLSHEKEKMVLKLIIFAIQFVH